MTPFQIVERLKRPYLVRASRDGDVLVPPPSRTRRPATGIPALPRARVWVEGGQAYYATGWVKLDRSASPPAWIEQWNAVENAIADVDAVEQLIRTHVYGAPTPWITYVDDARAVDAFLRGESFAPEVVVAVDAGDRRASSVVRVETEALEAQAERAARGDEAATIGAMSIADARTTVAEEQAQVLADLHPLMAVFPIVRGALQAQLLVALARRSIPVVAVTQREHLAALLPDPNVLSRFD